MSRGLNNNNKLSLYSNRGLSRSRELYKNKVLNDNRGLSDIQFTKMFSLKNLVLYDKEFETVLETNLDDIFYVRNRINFSPKTNQLLDNVYNKYSELYGNNRDHFNTSMLNKKFDNELIGKSLTRNDIANELRDRFYWLKHTGKLPDRIQYKNKVNIDKL